MPRFERHVFVCTNRRTPDNPKGCCASKGAEEVRARFKEVVKERGLKGRVRANSSGCLDACACGTTVVIYPEAVWYRGVTVDDVAEIMDRHVIGGQVVDRLLLNPREDAGRKLPALDPPVRDPET